MEKQMAGHPIGNTHMTSQEILRADVLDILFENRNKKYGAYELRRLYPARLSAAALASISFVGVLLFLFYPEYGKIPNPGPQATDTGIV